MAEAKQNETTIQLNTGDAMPLVGLGTWKIKKDVCAATVTLAIKLGYRLIDCACDYGNEIEVGAGIKAAIDAGYCTREELFVTSKLWNTYHAKEHVQMACEKTMKDLGLAYLDLYLIHFPIALAYVPIEERYPPEWAFDVSKPDERTFTDTTYAETWTAMEALKGTGLVKNIGVSNLSAALLMELLKTATIVPAANQFEVHPFLSMEVLTNYCKSKGIAVTAYSSFGKLSYEEFEDPGVLAYANLLENPTVVEVAKKVAKSEAQVLLRWSIQTGHCVIPKSCNEGRLVTNLDVCSFTLDAESMTALNAVNINKRFNDPAGGFCVGAPIWN